MTRHRFSILCVILLSLHLVSVSYGQSTWVGGTGVWSNANNWCPAALPNGVDFSIGACKFAPPSTVTDDTFASINNLSIDAGNSLTVAANVRLTINGASISNAGTLAMSGLNVSGEGAQILLGATPTVTLSGGGTFLMNDAPNLVIGAGSSMTLVNQETIQGAGTLGAEGFFNLNNQGLVDAQGTNPLQINTISGSSINTGTLQASHGGLLVLSGTSATNPLNNAGGTIQALDSSIVRLENPTFITGGTLTTKGTGLIHGVDGGLTNLTNAGLFQVGGINGFGSATIRLSGTITNSGTIQIGSPVWGDDGTEIDGAVTLTGGGIVNFANSIEQMVGGNGTPSVTNTNNTISGTGILGGGSGLTLTNSATVDANSASGPLVLVLSMTNTGTMEASNGGELRIEGDIKNSGGTIQALDKSKVTLVSNTITGGTLATSGSGVIQTASTQPLLDGVTNTGLLSIPSGAQAAFKDTITNSGTISADRAGTFIISGPVTLQGKGKVTLSNSGSNFISGGGTSPSWTNVDNLIEGAGTIAVPLTNQIKGTVYANVSNPLNLQTSPVTNLGTFQVRTGSTLDILGGVTFTNFSGTTLTGGTYIVAGIFEFSGANIATNAADIQLTSSTGMLLNSITSANALANLATNGKGALLKLSGSAVLNTGTAFANAGKVTLTKGTKFTIGGSYTQTVSGTTQVDGPGPLGSAGTIAATSFVLNGGTLQGAGGFINAPVTANATVIAGDSKTKTGTLNVASYTQGASGILDIQIKGNTSSTCSLSGAGTTFSLLNSENGIALDGTLKVNVIGTTLHSGDCYVIATGTAVSGDFATKPVGFTVKIATAATPPQVQLIVN